MGLFNNRIYVAELVDNHTVEEIDILKGKVREAFESRVAINLHVNASTQEGRSTSGISLAKPEDQLDFIAACQAAKSELNSGISSAGGNPSHTDYSRSPVQT